MYGVILNCMNVLLVALLAEKVAKYYIILAFIFGIAHGIYWNACHNMISSVTTKENRKTYLSVASIVKTFIKIIVPIAIGTSIEATSFTFVAIVIFSITILQMIISFFIKIEKNEKQNFNLLKYTKKLKKCKEETIAIKLVYRNMFIEGITGSLIGTLITVMTMMTFKSTFNLGILTTVFSICTIISLSIIQKFYKKSMAKKYITISAFFIIGSVLYLICGFGKNSVIVYQLCNAIFMVILTMVRDIQRYNCVLIDGFNEDIVENQTMNEIHLAMGRFVGYSLLLIMSFNSGITNVKITLLIATLFIIPLAMNLIKVEKLRVE